MPAKTRNLPQQFTQTHKSNFKNLLVSGGSYVWNNSEQHLCTWPYYLRDFAGFEQVYDASQSGSGCGHVFNSIINEIETNKEISSDNTLVIIMISDLAIFDTITSTDLTRPWHPMSNYDFNESFSTITLFKSFRNKATTSLEKLCLEYAKHIDMNAQVYENLIKIKALHAFLKDKNFTSVTLAWKDMDTFDCSKYFTNIETLDGFTERNQMRIPGDGHPSPDAHLNWTREVLVPFLENSGLISVK